MFRVWKKLEDGSWEPTFTYESMWPRWQFDELLDGKICEYTKGNFFTMKVPEGAVLRED